MVEKFRRESLKSKMGKQNYDVDKSSKHKTQEKNVLYLFFQLLLQFAQTFTIFPQSNFSNVCLVILRFHYYYYSTTSYNKGKTALLETKEVPNGKFMLDFYVL